jgi:hypothetical protein
MGLTKPNIRQQEDITNLETTTDIEKVNENVKIKKPSRIYLKS